MWIDPEPVEGDTIDGVTSTLLGLSIEKRPGLALVINNIDFDHMNNRSEYDRDYIAVKKFLADRNFVFFEEFETSNLNANQMIEVIERYSQIQKALYYNRGAVVILSHGWDRCFAAVDSSESRLISIDQLVSIFQADNVKSVNFKPEIFLLQQSSEQCEPELMHIKQDESPIVPG